MQVMQEKNYACKKNISSKKAVSLFSSRGIKQQLAGRIGKLLGVPQPAPDDQFPSFICESCQSKISFLEKAATELSRFKTLARCSLVQHGSIGESPLESRNLKRTKETSGEFGVSPDTARQRPRSKQARKRLSFGSLRRASRLLLSLPCLQKIQ